jgi:LmbE family N-acetylglucosaminyl deacetylase
MPSPNGALVVISPHLDDAVLSVGQLLGGHPGAIVITVLAGVPDGDAVTDYDRSCGFASSRQAMHQRRAEDRRALGILGAQPYHLDFLSRMYGDRADDEAVVCVLAERISALSPTAVAGPVGIFHPDHEWVARLWPQAARRAAPDAQRYAYEELPYRVKSRRRAAAAVGALATGHQATATELPMTDVGSKAHAMLAYVSQLRFVFPLDCLTPEHLWRLGEGSPGSWPTATSRLA